MEVMRPQLVRIGNRCYRKNQVSIREGSNPEDEVEPDFDLSGVNYDDEICDANFDIEEFSGGFRLHLDLPSAYFKFIIGKKGDMKKKIEAETRTQIKIPRVGQEGEIVVQGSEKKGVISAKTRIDVLVNAARQKQSFTHFLSIPIQSEDILEKFEDFKYSVMDDNTRDNAVDATIFQNPQKLHMTIGTLVLLSDKEILQAKDLLLQCADELVEPILKGSPLFIDIQCLEYMNDDPGAVDVLYAKILPAPEADKLQLLVDRLVDKFVTANLMQRQYEQVKLHITIMNTLFRKDPSGVAAPWQRNPKGPLRDRESFNATSILQKFGDFVFGSCQVDRVELSERYSTSQDGYYQSSGRLLL